MKKIFIKTSLLFFTAAMILSLGNINATASSRPELGIWITVFSSEKVLDSKENVDYLISFCQRTGINNIYIQIYRADTAYYDSSITNNSPFKERLDRTGSDTLRYLLSSAKEKNIKVHAWVNLLSLAQNTNANILKKYGRDVLTLDQYERSSMREGPKDNYDNYFIREDQLFLEPSDVRVKNYLLDIVKEILKKYPDFSGLHLDYIRYPSVVPFAPGARFDKYGIGYGYTKNNMQAFKNTTGLYPKSMDRSGDNCTLWDDWRRHKITELVKEISQTARNLKPSLIISATTVPSLERSYFVIFQDWTNWLGKAYVDHVVFMNYNENTKFMTMNAFSLLWPNTRDKIYIGLGAYLMKDDNENLKRQIDTLKKLSPGGIVIFSYDDIAHNTEIQDFLAEKFAND
ncbi:MAG: family 10 glycosylhydrolase [Candidatus Omnitrophica bacterium]|nr:family 10 glycosylhydrolase [Candidatus Omnitrophota bacterium]